MSVEVSPRTISVADAHQAMGERRYKKAIQICDEILEQMPDNATAICFREFSRWKRGADPADCISGLERALELAPNSSVVRQRMAPILISAGEMERARKLLTEGLENTPENVGLFLELSEITKFTEENDLLRRMKAMHERSDIESEKAETIGFGLAKAYADIKNAELAMHYAVAANAAAGREYDIETVRQRRADLEAYAATAQPSVRPAKPDEIASQPVFIVGMPRSGTTLVETIVSRHAGVFAGGELSVSVGVEMQVGKWLKDYRGIEAGAYTMLPHVPDTVWQQNAVQIEKIVRRMTDQKFSYFTDKMPHNAIRLPLISKLFPQARIIYVRRHPLDCCLSNFFKRFTQLPFSFQQDWLGFEYRNLTETVAISRKLITNPILDLSYDQLVANPEAETRRIVDFVGLDWDDAFLSPEKSDRKTVMTASRWQVRQPIYQSSKAKWKPYEPYLGELIEALGGMEWIEAEVAATALAASA